MLLKLLEDLNAPEEILGFHAQQAVEKFIKAALAFRGIHYRKTHDILELIDLANEHGLAFPPDLESVQRLSQYAVELRYVAVMPDEPPLVARSEYPHYMGQVKAWAEDTLHSAGT